MSGVSLNGLWTEPRHCFSWRKRYLRRGVTSRDRIVAVEDLFKRFRQAELRYQATDVAIAEVKRGERRPAQLRCGL